MNIIRSKMKTIVSVANRAIKPTMPNNTKTSKNTKSFKKVFILLFPNPFLTSCRLSTVISILKF